MNSIKVLLKITAITGLLISPFTALQTASANDMSDWQGKVGHMVAKKQVYPRSAMRSEQEGRAKIRISITRSGEIENFEILEKTGHEILDAEVPKLIERLNPLPAPPQSMTDEQLSFVLPISWRLQ